MPTRAMVVRQQIYTAFTLRRYSSNRVSRAGQKLRIAASSWWSSMANLASAFERSPNRGKRRAGSLSIRVLGTVATRASAQTGATEWMV